ncbi:MAG: hypothetical protein IPK08_06310 [Bacteroidetes bacterium]|nr:hypothetical protein [Bacteroidota bacterium]
MEYEPGRLFVKQYVRVKYAKANGEGIIIEICQVCLLKKAYQVPDFLQIFLLKSMWIIFRYTGK